MRFFLLIIFSIIFSYSGYSQNKQKLFIDTLDNAFDVSHYMYDLHGLLPLISPITEPAVGFGASLAAIYFIPKKDKDSMRFQMPDIAAVAGGLTENGTWFGGAGYLGFWNHDKIRYRGVIGYGDVKLKYYGNGNDFLDKNPINFSITSSFFLQQALFRISGSRFMIGGNFIFSKSVVKLFDGSDLQWIQPKDIELKNSGVGLIAEYENYDNFLSPNKGLRVNLNYTQFAQILGGDLDFGTGTVFMHYYIPTIKNKLVSAFRVEAQMATDGTPFYMKPFVYLRGVPAMRNQGDIVALTETEQLLLITRRWGLVAFGGLGSTYKTGADNTYPLVWSYGGGFRYLIARKLGLRMGVDLAKSKDDWGVYIVFGSSWIR